MALTTDEINHHTYTIMERIFLSKGVGITFEEFALRTKLDLEPATELLGYLYEKDFINVAVDSGNIIAGPLALPIFRDFHLPDEPAAGPVVDEQKED